MTNKIKSICILAGFLVLCLIVGYITIRLEVNEYNYDLERLDNALQNEMELNNKYVQILKTKVDNNEITVKEYQTKISKIIENQPQIELFDENDLVGKILVKLGLSQ